MTAYYNENDPYAAAWLRNLIAAGHIAAGDVDERSIADVSAADLAGYAQCHFFAGIGGWSHALRLAGWPDDRPVWTGSCPCQPFSAAGKGRGFDDERHLWPVWFRLIRERRPGVVFGEQVASKAGLAWLDVVQADLEDAEYAVAAVDLCAAGVGAPHWRQRLWFVANADGKAVRRFDRDVESTAEATRVARDRRTDGDSPVSGGAAGFVADAMPARRPKRRAVAGDGSTAGGAPARIVGDAQLLRCDEARAGNGRGEETTRRACGPVALGPVAAEHSAGPTNGAWRAADWLYCRDGKWRPVRPGSFPLAHGVPARVGRLRAYGNAIVPQVAAQFVAAFRDSSAQRSAEGGEA